MLFRANFRLCNGLLDLLCLHVVLQMDQITAFIDASNVYGSSEDDARELRTQRGGRLKVTRVGERDLLPLNTDMMDECTDPQRNLFCFKGGM